MTDTRPDWQASVPRVDAEQAARLARERFDGSGELSPLPSDRDRNWRVRAPEGPDLVLKVSNALEERELLELQNELLERLAAARLPWSFPRPVRTRDGELLTTVRAGDGVEHLVRAMAWLPGRLLAETRPRSPRLLEETGEMLGSLDRTLEGWTPAAAERDFHWDLRRGPREVEAGLGALEGEERRRLVRAVIEAYDEAVPPLEDRLRLGVIHGDANDWNVLVSEADRPTEARRVVGLIDFGDVVRSWLVAEPAVAGAYAMLDRKDPLAALASVARGYHRAYPLREAEADALYALARLRLAVSVVLSASQRRARPDNDYLSVSEAGAWRLLERLDGVHPRLARSVVREACGLEPHPASTAVRAWLGAHRDELAPVLDPDPVEASSVVLDFGLESPFLLELALRPPPADAGSGNGPPADRPEPGPAASAASAPSTPDARAWTRLIFGRMEEADAEVGLGRYAEVRPWYTSDAFRTETDEGPEWRTIHLGLDLFAPAGTPVRAPLDGVVEAAVDNAGTLDYGPTLVLRHEPADGPVFHTLYGHLSRETLEAIREGDAVARGQPIATLGGPAVNGGWAPHLHLQILVDPLDDPAALPGVARPSREAVWRSISPDPSLVCPVPSLEPQPRPPSVEALRSRRSERLPSNLTVSYRRPLHVVRGWMQHLYDAAGQAHLDCVNNVAHVGHGHPLVVRALARQAAVLNTNTRYLHQMLLRYADRLAASLPDPLGVCFLVCSGSEANELALRLARSHTGRRDVVVLDGAYHGNTGQLVEMSPYKFRGPGGRGRSEWVQVAALPDPYRGRWRAERDRDLAARYAGSVREALDGASERGGAAAFFAEAVPGCGGQVVPPRGYLARAFAEARAAGALCVADEVQIGFGRPGSHFWGFQVVGASDAEGIPDAVPDIVTMGKPIGNGHPLGAVVTTPEVAASFADGMEWFNTFGGNPVSCAVGLAVLDALEEGGMQRHAERVGSRLLKGLGELAERHALIGDVRGVGLFLGVELVLDRETREPAGTHAAALVERARDHRVLLSRDGPDHNVLKIKPPLPFDDADADRLVETLDRVLAEDAFRVD